MFSAAASALFSAAAYALFSAAASAFASAFGAAAHADPFLCSERERHTFADIAANHSTLVTPLCKPLFSHSNIEKICHARDRF
jgi:hypothetical protein